MPPHEQATRQRPKIIEFRMVKGDRARLKGTKFQAMTFNLSIPGPLIVVHEGDYVELTLVNPETNTMPHNIDFHAATGGLGGGELTLVNPGEQTSPALQGHPHRRPHREGADRPLHIHHEKRR